MLFLLFNVRICEFANLLGLARVVTEFNKFASVRIYENLLLALHGNETHKAGLKMIVDKNARDRVNTWFRTIFRVFKNETLTTPTKGIKKYKKMT